MVRVTPIDAPREPAQSALDVLERTFRPVPLRSSTFQQSGVYALIYRDEVVYVGVSRNVSGRVGGWCGRKSRREGELFDWDRALWMPVPWSVAALYEHALIRELSPAFNSRCNDPTEHDEEILFGLGLRETLDIGSVAWTVVEP